MQLPTLQSLENNLRHCLLLKADDLYFTLAEPYGAAIRNEFLGIEVRGLAVENLSEEKVNAIELDRFDVARRVSTLLKMLQSRSLSLHVQQVPDSEDGRNDGVEFLEHFLSTLPSVALGGLDMTAVRYGEVRSVYNLAYAWLNLIDCVADCFTSKDLFALTVGDLALLSGLDVRTLRNRCGPEKVLRTTPERTSLARDSAAKAFVSIHVLDALDWLRARKDFKISTIDPAWIKLQLAASLGNAPDMTRGLIIAAVVNHGPLSSLAPAIDATVEQTRQWFDEGTALPPATAEKLGQLLGLSSQPKV